MKYAGPPDGTTLDPYVAANPGVGSDGSRVPARAIEPLMRECVALIEAAGLVPSEFDLTQVRQAIQILATNTLSFQIGMIRFHAGATFLPGWIPADGTPQNRVTYATLFGILGTTFGPGDGATTFGIPNLQGRGVIGMGQAGGLTNRLLGQFIGAETHQLDLDQIPNHRHQFVEQNNPLGVLPEVFGAAETRLSTAKPTSGMEGTANPLNVATPHENMGPSLVVNAFIKRE